MKKFILLFLLMVVSVNAATSTWKVRDSDGDTIFVSSDGNIYHSGDILYLDDAINWSVGNVIFVPLAGDIQTYIDAADSGATLVLASGAYTITDTLIINKQLNIVGQGSSGFVTTPVTPSHGTLITSSTANMVAFQINNDNVRISDLSINLTGAASTGVKIANNLEGIALNDIDVIISSTGAVKGFDIKGSDVVMRDLTFYITSTDASSAGAYFWNDNTTTRDAVVDCYNVTGTVVGDATYAYAFACYNINDANTLTLNLSASVCKALTGTPLDIAVISTSTVTNNSTVNAYMCTFDGADYDGYQTGSNVLSLGGSVMMNNLISGTVTYRATMISDAVQTNVIKTDTIKPTNNGQVTFPDDAVFDSTITAASADIDTVTGYLKGKADSAEYADSAAWANIDSSWVKITATYADIDTFTDDAVFDSLLKVKRIDIDSDDSTQIPLKITGEGHTDTLMKVQWYDSSEQVSIVTSNDGDCYMNLHSKLNGGYTALQLYNDIYQRLGFAVDGSSGVGEIYGASYFKIKPFNQANYFIRMNLIDSYTLPIIYGGASSSSGHGNNLLLAGGLTNTYPAGDLYLAGGYANAASNWGDIAFLSANVIVATYDTTFKMYSNSGNEYAKFYAPFTLPLCYHLDGDSIVTELGDTIAVPRTGMMICDTSGGDTVKCYLNSAWEVK